MNSVPQRAATTFAFSSVFCLSSMIFFYDCVQGRVGYGGFVGLSVETYDFARHLLPDGMKTSGSPAAALGKYEV